MLKPAEALCATESQKRRLAAWVRCGTTQQRGTVRCHIVRRAIAGKSNNAIAEELDISRPTVIFWRKRIAEGGPEVLLYNLPRSRRILSSVPQAGRRVRGENLAERTA